MTGSELSLGKGKNMVNVALNNIKGGIKRKEIEKLNDPKMLAIFDKIDKGENGSGDGILTDAEVQAFMAKMNEAAAERGKETNLSRREAKHFLKDQGFGKEIKKDDLFKFVKMTSQNSENIDKCSVQDEICTIEYQDGTIEQINTEDNTSSLEKTDEEGNTTIKEFNAKQEMVKESVIAANQTDNTTTTYLVDENGNLVLDKDGNPIPAEKTTVEDEGQIATQTLYDENGKLKEQTIKSVKDNSETNTTFEEGIPQETVINKGKRFLHSRGRPRTQKRRYRKTLL